MFGPVLRTAAAPERAIMKNSLSCRHGAWHGFVAVWVLVVGGCRMEQPRANEMEQTLLYRSLASNNKAYAICATTYLSRTQGLPTVATDASNAQWRQLAQSDLLWFKSRNPEDVARLERSFLKFNETWSPYPPDDLSP